MHGRMRPAPLTSAEAEMSASHAVMELVRSNSVLSLMVMQMREAGLSWRGVKTAIEAEIERRAPQGAPPANRKTEPS